MAWSEALWWLPAVAVAVMTALGVAAARQQPAGSGKTYWIAGLCVVGAAFVAISALQEYDSRGVLGSEAERLRELGGRLDAVGRLLPAGPGKTPDETFDTVTTAIRALNDKIKDLESQIDALKEKAKGRTITPDTAAKMAEYLRPFGSRRVVVSCVPDDVEAYDYANQIANMLRAGGWDATEPEKTAIFGDAAAMGVRLFVRGGGAAAPDTAKILVDGFTRLNIPFESGVTPSDAIPDPATVELFVSHKP